MAALLEELKRRNVIRVAVGYLVLAWVVLQITDLVAPALRLPEWTLSLVTFLGIMGFPFALFFAWAFELTPEGIKRSEDVTPEDSITGQTAGNLNRIIISLLCLAVTLLLADRYLGLSSRVSGSGSEPAEAPVTEEMAAEQEGRPRSIAVLPFVNMSNDSEQEYFSDGISEELLNALAKIRELRVAARTSSFAFKGKNQDITDIGAQLNVEAVLEGSVRKSGKRVRITAQLIDVADGYHLWSETYDRDLTDIFAVQDEISAAIVEALKVHLTEGSAPALSREVDLTAYNLFLQARHNVRERSRQSLELALKQFQQAIDIDPRYAAAWAGMALATSLLREDSYGDLTSDEASRRAQEFLDTAFAIDPNLGEAHAAQALVFQSDNRCKEALASIERALQTMPNEGVLYAWQSFCLRSIGDYRAADAAVERAFEVDPLHRAVRANWILLQARIGDYAAVRASTTPGTTEYYEAEWAIAEREGRWADMYLLMEAAQQAGDNGRMASFQGQTLFVWLGEPERGVEMLPAIWGLVLQSIREPQQILDTLGQVAPEDLAEGQLFVLQIALQHKGMHAEVVRVTAHRNLESRQGFDDPTAFAGPFDQSLQLAWSLQQIGEETRARALATRLIGIIDQSAARGLDARDYGDVLSVLQVMTGDTSGAVRTLRERKDLNNLAPIEFKTIFPNVDVLADREDFQQLRSELEQHLNRERAKLGWEPTTL